MKLKLCFVLVLALALNSGAGNQKDSFDRLLKMIGSDKYDPITLSDLYSSFHSYRNAVEVLPDAEWCRRQKSEAYCRAVEAKRKLLSSQIKKDGNPADSPDLMVRLKQDRLSIVQERDLPAGMSDSGEQTAQDIPHPAGVAVVSASCSGHDCLAVSVSQDIDPRGEVSSGGYWAHLSIDGGKTWRGPYYMGFAEQFPYVIRSNKNLQPFQGDMLQLFADIREADESSITFPPVGLRAKRIKTNISLEIPRAAMLRDSDGDGLTDLYEEKIVSDPHSVDTDHDGIGDAEDSQPLTPWNPEHSEEDEVILAALQNMIFGNAVPIQQSASFSEKDDCVLGNMKVQGHPFTSQRVLFIQSDRPLLNSYELPVRTIVLSASAVELYNKKFGATYMLRIGEVVFNHEHTRAFFSYDFEWEGGSFSARKVHGKWIVHRERGWVT